MAPSFTYDECYRVFSRFLQHDTASEMARSCTARLEESRGPLHVDGDLKFSLVSNTELTEDTLILLSLDSPELDAKVRAYRAALRMGAPETPAEAAERTRRRDDLKAWADAGYPRDE